MNIREKIKNEIITYNNNNNNNITDFIKNYILTVEFTFIHNDQKKNMFKTYNYEDVNYILEDLQNKSIDEILYELNYENYGFINLKYEIKNNMKKSYDQYFYSSQINTDLNTFKNKTILWATEQFDQALLHIFDYNRYLPNDLIQPSIYKFKLKKKIQLLISNNKNNDNIFHHKLPDTLKSKISKILHDEGIHNFKGENNKYILYILEEINTFLPPEFKFDGYKNNFDQNEIAFINFKDVVDEITIIKNDYLEVYNKNQSNKLIIKFPITINDFITKRSQINLMYTDIFNYPNKYRMIPQTPIIIKYGNSEINEWNSYDEPDTYYKQKYLKYKQKYLKYKRKYLQFTPLKI